MKKRTIFVTEEDMERLRHLIDSAQRGSTRDLEHLEMLREELDTAEIVSSDEVPEDVVTMNSKVRVRDMDSGSEAIYVLVFPRDATWRRDASLCWLRSGRRSSGIALET
ncbi:MAG TPA: hypothetical protein VFQ00_05920 [Terriglobales bacterium]|nr:hypothetical protein [Terriglobales bacterium]